MSKPLHTPPSLAILPLILVFAAAFLPQIAYAFPTDTYAVSSVLAEGKWVKISVTESGLHIIPTATLRSWGFPDPSKVRVYGYGGRRIDDLLSEANYIDDLPLAASELTSAGLVFYAAGPDRWVASSGNRYRGELSPYTSYGYYFLTENAEPAPELPLTGINGASNPTDIAQGRLHHELEQTLPSEAGPIMTGEDFRTTRSRQFDFKTPGRSDNEVQIECQFVHRHIGTSASLYFEVDGNATGNGTANLNVPSTSDSHYVHASLGISRFTATTSANDAFRLSLTYQPSRTVYLANLDYISVNYNRRLELDAAGFSDFWSNASQLRFNGDSDTRIWDVTDPWAVEKVNTVAGSDGKLTWSVSRSGMRSYVAWRPGATLPSPRLVGSISNQNLHADAGQVDMVIFAPRQLTVQAQRIASLHEDEDSMKVLIVNPEEVYNEFSSGAPDVAAFRKYLKMLYDRGNAAGTPLRYALIMGRATLDHRNILETTRRSGYINLPTWVVNIPRLALNDNDGYCSDDIIAMLEDNSGNTKGTDKLSIAVGRIPATSVEDVASSVDKLYQYVQKSKNGIWKNRVLIVADDGDRGKHLQQADTLVNNMLAAKGQQHTFNKVYIDAYELISGTCPDARKEMYGALADGTSWWIFTGHANDHSWTDEDILTYNDINNNVYFRNIPFMVAGTCDFLRWDAPKISGGELLYSTRYGGVIAMISAARPVYIPNNGYFMAAIGRHAFDRDEDGRLVTAGEVYRRTKNDLRSPNPPYGPLSDENRLRYVFMGDPALRIVSPSNTVQLTSIDGKAVTADAQISIPALSNSVIEGYVSAPDGNVLTDFNGSIILELYDALTSRTTLAHHGDEGSVNVYDVMGDKLYAGAAKVENGYFSAKIAMPANIADNFRPATLSMYAAADNSDAEAIGVNRDFYVAGYSEPEVADTIKPIIESMVLNHSDFANGETVNTNPLLIASVSDNVGINISSAGVGHQLILTLDEMTTFSDLASFYTPKADGTPGGIINYQLENLSAGAHTIRLRVFDTSGNMAQQEIEFFVNPEAAPRIFDVFTDANPASTSANFYIRHDRPENLVEVGIEVFDLLGHPVWSASQKGVSDMDLSTPVTWNLCDRTGRRVNRGIYLYRATITTDNANYQTATRRIAVTAR